MLKKLTQLQFFLESEHVSAEPFSCFSPLEQTLLGQGHHIIRNSTDICKLCISDSGISGRQIMKNKDGDTKATNYHKENNEMHEVSQLFVTWTCLQKQYKDIIFYAYTYFYSQHHV